MSDQEYSDIIPGWEFYWVGAHKFGYPPIVVIAKECLENDFKPGLWQWYFKVPDIYHVKIGFDIGEYVRIDASELCYGPNTGKDEYLVAYEAMFEQLIKEGKFYYGLFENISDIHEGLRQNLNKHYQYLLFDVGFITHIHKNEFEKRVKNILLRIDNKAPQRVLELKQSMIEQQKSQLLLAG